MRKFLNEVARDKIFIFFLILFVLKGVIYATYITPPTAYTSPDDTGHISYIQYIATEKKLPVLHEEQIEIYIEETIVGQRLLGNYDVSAHSYEGLEYDFQSATNGNWIVQHPPLYYIIGAVVYSIITIFTQKFSLIVIGLRLFSLFFGVVTLIYLRKLFKLLNWSDTMIYIALSIAVFSPAIQYYFSMVTNDALLICLATIGFYYLMAFVKTDKIHNAYLLVIISALIMYTKYTGGLIVLGFVLVFLYNVISKNKLKDALPILIKSGSLGVVLVTPLFAFNIYHYAAPFTTAGPVLDNYDYSFLHFILASTYVEELVRNISSLVGWNWQTMVTADTTMLIVANIVLATLVVVHFKSSSFDKIKTAVSFATAFCAYYIINYITHNFYMALLVALLGVIFVLGVYPKDLQKSEWESNLFSWLIIIVVFLIFMYQHYFIFLHRGVPGATHGRYYCILLAPTLYLLINPLKRVNEKAQIVTFAVVFVSLIYSEIVFIGRLLEAWEW